MHIVKKTLAAISLSLIAVAAIASPENPQNGKDYRTLDKVQQTESTKKVEVLEFFSYACSHCSSFEPVLAEWVKKQGDNIVFKRVPVGFRPQWVPLQQLYYALESMGKADEISKKIFHEIHVERKTLDNEAAIAEFVAKQGIDKKKFLDIYNSFSVQTKVRRTSALLEAYKVDGVPLIAIDGRFETAPSIVSASIGNQPEQVLGAATLQVMDVLVAKVIAERKSQVVEAKPAASGK